jgi:hypothetical protein
MPTTAAARARTALSKTTVAPAMMLTVSAIRAAACRMRSRLVATCSQAGMAWPAESLPNTLSFVAS